MRRINISIGDKFSNLTVIAEPTQVFKGTRPTRMVETECVCSTKKTYRVDQLSRGLITSCGCVTKSTANSQAHWASSRYYNIKRRCYDVTSKDYKNYGARGIKMYTPWLEHPRRFNAWCDITCADRNLTIERKDVNGNYEPDNLIWVSRQEQMFNRTDNQVVTHGNKIMSVAQVYQESPDPKTNYDCFRARLKRGWRVDEALKL